jgi:serine/threonine protein kinase
VWKPHRTFRLESAADSRTDLFAFGAVLYEMATGKRAFNATSEASLIAAILKEEPTPLSRVRPLTPLALENLVKSCLVKDPEERLQNATDLKHALRWISDSISQSASQTPTAVASRRAMLPWALFAAAVLLGAISVAFLLPKRSGENVLPGSNRITLAAPPEHSVVNLAVSPDGQTVVFVTSGSAGRKLYLRHTNRFETIEFLNSVYSAYSAVKHPFAFALKFSFVTESNHRIYTHGAPRRNITGHQCDNCQQNRDSCKRDRIKRAHSIHELRNESG